MTSIPPTIPPIQPVNILGVNILGVNVTAQRFDDAITTLAGWAADHTADHNDARRYVSTCPVYTIMMCTENPAVMEAVNRADMVTADGVPVVWVQRLWGAPQAERVYGPDVLLALCERTAGQGIRHYFWGGLPGVPEKLADTLTAKYPGLEIAGVCSPPVAPLGSTPDPETVRILNESNADVIWVGLGSPKQDLWMSLYRPVLNARLLIAVGAAFDFHSGTKTQAPRWMQRSGLEWIFRLLQEPRRLGRRYLVYNPRFVLGVFRQHLQKR